MSLRGIVITEGKVGVNAVGDNREFGIIANGAAVVGKALLATPYVPPTVPSDAVALGIDAAYDTTNLMNEAIGDIVSDIPAAE